MSEDNKNYEDNTDIVDEIAKPEAENPKHKVISKKRSGKVKKPEINKNNRIKIIVVVAIILIIITAVIYIIALFNTSEGEKLANGIAIGRNIEYVQTDSGVEFKDTSNYPYLTKISDFDVVHESDKTVKVNGITLPEWAVLITQNSDNLIDTVTYYDFSQLQKNWKGNKSTSRIDNNTIKYGMKAYEVKNKLGFKPYYIQTGIDNTKTYVYRYYFSDTQTNNDVVVNLFVVYDVNDKVKLTYSNDIDYAPFLLSIK